VLNGVEVTGGNIVGKSVDAKGNGNATGGGGIANNGSLTLELAAVSGNSVTGAKGADGAAAGAGGVAAGGGIDNTGTLSIDASTIQGNSATGGSGGNGTAAGLGGAGEGGGIANNSSGTLVLGDGSKVLANTAAGGTSGTGPRGAAAGSGVGGGLWSEGSTYISADTLTNNVGQAGGTASTPSDAEGGAIDATGGKLEVQATTIADNEATTSHAAAADGGGGIATSAQTTIENSTITGNTTSGSGGGIDAFGDGESIVSSTLSGNSAGSGGGNLAASGAIDLQQTIISGGIASSGATDCTGTVKDYGHNLESTAPSQCGLSATKDDVIGQDPLLGPLADNGGPTETMALLPGSPAIDAGGTCRGVGGYVLTVDQRASARGAPCDIGAFETRVVPSNQSAPTVSGTASVGQQLSCNPGAWSSPDAVTYSYLWLRSGQPIRGAHSQTYRVRRRDAGKPLRCRVSASNDDGYASPQSSTGVWVARAPSAHRHHRHR
jgi:hypothetical protein